TSNIVRPPQAKWRSQVTLQQLLNHEKVRGICIGACVDGSDWSDANELAHAHVGDKANRGWICVRSPRYILKRGSRNVSALMLHEFSHLEAHAGHTEAWRSTMRELGQPIPAQYRRKKKR